MGALTENHRCSRGNRLSRLAETLATLTVGGVAGGLVVFAINEQPAEALVLAAAALGAVLASAVRQAVR
jgi:hypothetical protein